jgi:hypothetical protein
MAWYVEASSMTYNELLQAFFGRSDALQTLWTIYVTVVGALLAFCATRESLGLRTMAAITLTFCLFSAGNLSGMHDVTLQRIALKAAIVSYQSPKEPNPTEVSGLRHLIEPTLSPPPFWGPRGVFTFHIAFDVLTVAVLWITAYRRQKLAGHGAGRKAGQAAPKQFPP